MYFRFNVFRMSRVVTNVWGGVVEAPAIASSICGPLQDGTYVTLYIASFQETFKVSRAHIHCQQL